MSALEQIAPRIARAQAAAQERAEHPPSGPFTMEPFLGRVWCRGCGRGVQMHFDVQIVERLGRWRDEHVCIDGERHDGR